MQSNLRQNKLNTRTKSVRQFKDHISMDEEVDAAADLPIYRKGVHTGTYFFSDELPYDSGHLNYCTESVQMSGGGWRRSAVLISVRHSRGRKTHAARKHDTTRKDIWRNIYIRSSSQFSFFISKSMVSLPSFFLIDSRLVGHTSSPSSSTTGFLTLIFWPSVAMVRICGSVKDEGKKWLRV